jgi:hypothetical protein
VKTSRFGNLTRGISRRKWPSDRKKKITGDQEKKSIALSFNSMIVVSPIDSLNFE